MIIPPKLKQGDEIRVIAPARSLSIISHDVLDIAIKRLEKEGFKITFSENCRETDMFASSSIKSRLDDLHKAFSDKKVKAIFAIIGGFNANQILSYIDYELIKKNPKIFCGYSDITVLANAITAKTDLVTYSGLNFSTFGMKKEFDYNMKYFEKCLVEKEDYEIKASKTWTDDTWFLNQDDRHPIINEGYTIINKGLSEGIIFGGNLCTFNLLQGTEFMPDISNSILFIEDDDLAGNDFASSFDRDLQSLIHQLNFDKVKGIVIGRFQKKSNMDLEKLKYIIKTKKELKNIPVIANVDFGHTNPMITFPIGGTAKLMANNSEIELSILKH